MFSPAVASSDWRGGNRGVDLVLITSIIMDSIKLIVKYYLHYEFEQQVGDLAGTLDQQAVAKPRENAQL